MQFGFGREEITPRLGVELAGYSGYLNRYASAVRDRLYARAMAVSDGSNIAVVVSCDLVFIPCAITAEVRRQVSEATGLPPEATMLHATHTHSGPCVQVEYRNAYDPPYMRLLPRRLAGAAIAAVESLAEAKLSHAEVPCEGMGTNRVYDSFNYGEAALDDGFCPEKPELTDTTCHVLKVEADGRVVGFLSYFGCHNVVGGSGSTYVHGDYGGIATGMIEREHPGSVGLFLQGAEGDINAAGCVFGNEKVLKALDVMASRYARSVRQGMAKANAMSGEGVKFVSQRRSFPRLDLPLEKLRNMLAAEEEVINSPDADTHDHQFRMAVMRSLSLQDLIVRMERGESFEHETELHGIRFGPVTLLGAPFEIFHAIKEDVVAGASSPVPLVMSLTNDEQGYAPDRTTSENESDYAARTVPLWKHTLPYKNIHDELVSSLLDIDGKLNG